MLAANHLDSSVKAAREEVAADYAGQLWSDGDTMEQFIQQNQHRPSLLKTLAEAFRNLWRKLTGKERTQAEEAAYRLEKAYARAVEAQRKAGKKNATQSGGGDARYAIKSLGKYLYVQADRQVLSGDDSSKWGKQIESFINEKIRKGEDVLFPTTDGHILALTERSAYKLSDQHRSQISKEARTLLSDKEFALKGRIAGHIDELIQVGVFSEYKNDINGAHANGIGADGFNYYTAYFKDADGSYYRVRFSSAVNADNETVYSIGNIQKRSLPSNVGSSGNSGALNGSNASFDNTYTTATPKSQAEKTPMQIAIEEAQAKSNTRFSLRQPVEEVGDLVAVHNTSEDSLLSALELGGLPMPSIAVVKAADGFDKYGTISLVFNKSTIDPQTDSRNKVYGGDAWTPTAPRVDYQVNPEAATAFEQEIHRLSGNVSVADGIFGNRSSLRSMGVDDTSAMSVSELAKKISRTDTARAAYLADQGGTLEPVKKEKVWNKQFGNDTLQKVIDRIGIQKIAEMEARLEAGENRESVLGENAEVVRDILREYYRKKAEPFLRKRAASRNWTATETHQQLQAKIDSSMQNVTLFSLEDVVRNAWSMYEDGGATKGDIDRYATSDALREAVNDSDVEKWVAQKLNGLLGDAGIYNGKDQYTASGNRKSFWQMHYAYTLENIVKAMKETQQQRGGNTWGVSAKTLQSVATPEYRSIKEIKADSRRLGLAETTEYDAKAQAIDERIGSIISEVKQSNETHSDNSFIESDIIAEILMGAAKGKKTVDAIVKAFSKEGYKISSQTAQNIQSVFKAAAEMPTGYFEAKPQRAVGFDEVLTAVIPDNSSSQLLEGLKNAGVRTLEYEAGNEADRLAKLNSVENSRFSLRADAELEAAVREIQQKREAGELSAEEAREQIIQKGEEAYQRMIEQYGEIQQGEKPARQISVPKQTSKDAKVTQTIRTVLEARVTPDMAVPDIKTMVARGAFSYEVIGDKATISDAKAKIVNDGWANAYSAWMQDMKKGVYTKFNTALGAELYNNAVNHGDVQMAMDILMELAASQRAAGQVVQATKIIKQLSPEAQLFGVARGVKSIQEELNRRYGDENAPTLIISEELAEQYMKADTEQARENALTDIYRNIGEQIPPTFTDKWNAWRYLAMLGNPRTQVRNVLGNLFFAPVVMAKNAVGMMVVEPVGQLLSGKKSGKSKSFYTRELYRAALSDYANVESEIMNGAKYNDSAMQNSAIREGQRIFRFKQLEASRKLARNLLDAGDAFFCKRYYAAALASYAKANGITVRQLEENGAGLAFARAYAIREAQRGTYRDVNAFSEMVTKIGNAGRNSKNPLAKAGHLLVEGVLPFKKTPANILVRGVEYSPLGILTSVSSYVKEINRQGITTDERKAAGIKLMDGISAGLTGTGLMALGFLMARLEWLRGHGSEDDEEREAEEMVGHQAYSLEIGGVSVTLDWLAPEAIPLLIGVNLAEIAEERQKAGLDSKLQMKDYLSAITRASEPMSDMSMLQGLNDVLENLSYAEQNGTSSLTAFVASAATSYITQIFPTIFGQIERTLEDKRYTAFTDKTSWLSTDAQYIISKTSAKIPGVDYQQIPYIDAWGRTESTGSGWVRALNNFVNPAYVSKIEEGAVEKELMRLYNSTGESGVFPDRAKKSFKVDNKDRYLTAEEYVSYATKKGTQSRTLVERLISSSEYKKLSDESKADAISYAYDLADYQAKQALIPGYKKTTWEQTAVDLSSDYKISAVTYIKAKALASDIKSIKDSSGESIANSKGLQIMEILYSSGVLNSLTKEQRTALLDAVGVGKTIIDYSEKTVQLKLKEMRKR